MFVPIFCFHFLPPRYLENSGCVGMCVNMCKIPTQDFFTNEFGLPLTMIPSMTLTLISHYLGFIMPQNL